MFERGERGWQRVHDGLVAEIETHEDGCDDLAESPGEDDVVAVETERHHPVGRQLLHAATHLHRVASQRAERIARPAAPI